MARWLYKQEPDGYSYSSLERDGETLWDGVNNPLALKYLREAKPGDQVFFYHTGDDKAVVGVMEVTGPSRPDPKLGDPKLGDPKRAVVPVKPIRRLANPVTLAAIKADPAFAGWELVRIARLSVMPVSDEIWAKIEAMAGGIAEDPAPRAVGKRK